MLAQVSKMAHRRIGAYWHMLPTLIQARKAVWDNITGEGSRLIASTFPREVIAKRNEAEMKLELKCGSIIQLLGADNFDSNIGSNPVHVTYSEYALSHPRSWNLIRPILTENNGTAAFISTPRGLNDFHDLGERAKADTAGRWYRDVMDIRYTGVMTDAQVAQEIADGMPEELARQEYYCDFSAANVGAILGRWIEQAERQGRVHDFVYDPEGAKLELSCDIGFNDTATFWLWQRLPDGWYALIGYDEANGRDAADWIEAFQGSGWTKDKIGTLWMPHDSKARTFATKTSSMEQFKKAGYNVKLVPLVSKAQRIEAARKVARRCLFSVPAVSAGLKALRAWQFEYNEETKQFSKEPLHDWASHGGDGFSYGALAMNPRAIELPPSPPAPLPQPKKGVSEIFSLDDLWETAPSGAR